MTYYENDHLGNLRVAFTPVVDCQDPALGSGPDAGLNPDNSSFTLDHVVDYFPYGKVLRQYVNSDPERYLSTQHERDQETGLDYRGARYYDSDIARFLSLDPLASTRIDMSPYNYVSGNPIYRIDPDGKSDGWIKDANGNVEWDENTNSQSEFDKNYSKKDGYSYVSDPDNPNSYTLPSGEGQLIMNHWEDGNGGNIENGAGTVSIDIEFRPSNANSKVGWTQTYTSNTPDVDSKTVWTTLPGHSAEERLDGFGEQSTDLNRARYFAGYGGDIGTPSPILHDAPMRALIPGAVEWLSSMRNHP